MYSEYQLLVPFRKPAAWTIQQLPVLFSAHVGSSEGPAELDSRSIKSPPNQHHTASCPSWLCALDSEKELDA
eukprot:775329-Amphidinium_carterae.1